MQVQDKECPIYAAGYDAAVNGANMTNCNFALFGTPENKRKWEAGNAAGKAARKNLKAAGRATCALFACLLLSGCGWWNKNVTAMITSYTVICVTETNVQYVQFPTGAAVLVDTQGNPVPCGG